MNRAIAVVACVALIAAPKVALAAGTPWIGAEVLAGAAKPDASLADFQWDVRPEFAWGAGATVGMGAWSGGLRFTHSSSTQAIGDAASSPTADVAEEAIEGVARYRVAGFGGQSVHALATAGRLRLSYDPDRVTVDAGGTPVEVALSPVSTWAYGGGVAVDRALGGGLTGGIEVAYRAFALDTAHRSGTEIVTSRETFGSWNARVSLGVRIGSIGGGTP